MMELLIKAGAVYHIILVIFHLFFWRIFNWENDLQSLSFINQQTMQVMNIVLIIVFCLFAYISLAYTRDLLSTPLGHTLLLSISFLWFARAAMQMIFYKAKHWVSFVFLIYFLAGGLLYGLPAMEVM